MKRIIIHAGFHEFEICEMEERPENLNTNFPFSKNKLTLYTNDATILSSISLLFSYHQNPLTQGKIVLGITVPPPPTNILLQIILA
jgi:hypothetical protein